MKPELRFETKKMMSSDLGPQACVPDLIGEHILQNDTKFDLGEHDEIYEGFGRKRSAYPYRQYNSYTRELKEKDIKIAVLENDYLKAVFLPEYGGRLWELWDKTTGKNLLYTNDVLRFSNLAVRNAWFSGGVEWNIGIIGHHAFTTQPMYTAETETEDGLPVLRFYEYERIRQVPYQIDFWLEEDGRFLNCRMRIVNESSEVIPMYWWSNMAVPEYENGRVVVPAEQAFTGRKGMIVKVDIPMVDGVEVTDYKKIPNSVDYFFAIQEEKPKFIANLDQDGYGLLQISTKRLQGRKLFSWGKRPGSDHWQEFLTDKAGRYVEIQAGLGKTQYGCIPMAPHTSWEWLEQYGAVQATPGHLDKTHKERADELTSYVLEAGIPGKLEEKLKATASMAKKEAKVVITGSGYGSMKDHSRLEGHLKYETTESLKKWEKFFETGLLHEPAPEEIPDEFLINEDNLDFLLATLDKQNKDNWYAHYQAGVGYFTREDYTSAEKELKTSWYLRKSAWAAHALASAAVLSGHDTETVQWIGEGLKLEHKNLSYLKDALKLLSYCKAWEEIIRWYEAFDEEEKKAGKLRYYYIPPSTIQAKRRRLWSFWRRTEALRFRISAKVRIPLPSCIWISRRPSPVRTFRCPSSTISGQASDKSEYFLLLTILPLGITINE